MDTSLRTGIVIKSTGSRYMLRDMASQAFVECRLRGRLRLSGSRSTNPVVVGDIVDYEPEQAPGGTGALTTGGDAPASEGGSAAGNGAPMPTGTVVALHPRRNYIIRRASNLSKESHVIAANIDRAFLVVTLTHPVTNNEFVDRFLVTAEAYHIPATLLLNKTDLYTTDELQMLRAEFLDTYIHAGYDVIELSASEGAVTHLWAGIAPGEAAGSGAGGDRGLVTATVAGEGLDPLRKRLAEGVTLLSGNSGVGKSTLLRALDPSLDVRVGEVSDAHHKGKHTTTFSEMYPLAGGGYLIDTPGIKGFGLIDITGAEICRYFPELFRLSHDCSYNNCTHTHEPGCAVKEALERGEVSLSRYESYLKLLDDDEKYRR